MKPTKQLLQESNIPETGGWSEKSPGKEDDPGMKGSNYWSLSVKSCREFCAIT